MTGTQKEQEQEIKGRTLEREHHLEMEMEELALDEKQIKITNEERVTIKRLQLEEIKLEIEEKIITINKRDKLSDKLSSATNEDNLKDLQVNFFLV